MRINANGRECMEFWARVEAEEHEREREIERQHELDRDGLDYINPDANCGANDPKTPHSSVDISYEVNVSFVPIAIRGGNSVDSARATALDWMDKKGDTAEIVRVTREVVEVLDGCGHA